MTFLLLVFRRRWFIGVSTIVAAVLAVGFSAYTLLAPSNWKNPLPNRYTSEAKLLILPSQSSALSSAMGVQFPVAAAGGGSSGGNFLKSLAKGAAQSAVQKADFVISILKGNVLADEVANHFDFAKGHAKQGASRARARDRYYRSVSGKYDQKTGILTIGYTSTDRAFAARALSYTLGALQLRLAQLSSGQAVEARQFLKVRVDQAKRALDEASGKLIAFQNSHGIVDLPQQAANQAAQILSLEARIQSDETKIKMLSRYSGLKNDPRVLRLRTDIQVSREYMDQLQQGSKRAGIGGISEKRLPSISVAYANLSLEVKLQSTIYASLRKEYETARLEASADSKAFQVIEKPEVPEIKSGAHRSVLTIAVVFIVFLIAVIISVTSGRMKERQRMLAERNRPLPQ